jgi:hypothetical protein
MIYTKWTKTARPNLQKVDLLHSTKKWFMNIDLNCGFRVSASRILKEMLELSTLSFKGGRWTSEQSEPNWLENSGCRADHLKFILYSLLQGADLQARIHLWFMHDGAPPHFLLPVWDFLNKEFPRQWIGWDGSTAWPARLPDTDPFDIYVWGHLKFPVKAIEVIEVQDLQQRIQKKYEIINLHHTWKFQVNRAVTVQTCSVLLYICRPGRAFFVHFIYKQLYGPTWYVLDTILYSII